MYCFGCGQILLGAIAATLSRDAPEKRKWDHNDLVLGEGVRIVIDISILTSKHSIVGPLRCPGLLNSFVVMAFVFASSMNSSDFSIVQELMKKVNTDFVALDFSGSRHKQSTHFLAM